ncbi:MAG: hypothetical protein WBN06_04975, partial [Lysobacterales bacterium]
MIIVLLLAVGMLLFERFWVKPTTGSPAITTQTTQAPAATTQSSASDSVNSDSEKDTPATSDEPSVAVLPFVNMSSDPEQEYFSDGISEEILNVLTRIP